MANPRVPAEERLAIDTLKERQRLYPRYATRSEYRAAALAGASH